MPCWLLCIRIPLGLFTVVDECYKANLYLEWYLHGRRRWPDLALSHQSSYG